MDHQCFMELKLFMKTKHSFKDDSTVATNENTQLMLGYFTEGSRLSQARVDEPLLHKWPHTSQMVRIVGLDVRNSS